MTSAAPLHRLQMHFRGEMQVLYDGAPRPLPHSRKTRALLAYLALAPRRHPRVALCNLLWEDPNDPRAALRWSLSKLRQLLLCGDRSALVTDRDSVGLERTLIAVDVLEAQAALAGEPASIADAALADLDDGFTDACLAGLDDAGGTEYQLWLASEREAIRRMHRRVLDERIARAAASDGGALPLARKRVALDPLHTMSNIELLELTLRANGRKDAQATLARMRARYREQGLADDDLLAAWHRISASAAPVAAASARPPRVTSATGLAEAAAEGSSVGLPDKPSIAVLGFEDIGAHQHGGVLAEGLAVDITSRLAQSRGLFVIARASAARFSPKRTALAEISRRLGVRYLIYGTTRRQDMRIRVTASLVDAPRETVAWSEHFDRPLDDLFAVQDEITGAVMSAVEPAIERAEIERAFLTPTENLNAWECYHRALWHCFRFTAEDNELAHHLLQRSLALDARFSRAHAGVSFTHYSRAFLNAVPDVEGEVGRALEAAQHSVRFDERDSLGHWALGRALFLSREHDRALEAIRRSLAANPNYALGHYALGFIGVHAGIPKDALPELDLAQRLSPFDPLLFAMISSRALSLTMQGNVEDAAAWSVRATQAPNAHFHIYAIAAGCLELAGRSAEARRNAESALRKHPQYSLEVFQRSFPCKHQQHRHHLLEAMTRAGVPRR